MPKPNIARLITKFSQKEIQDLFKRSKKVFQQPELEIRKAKTYQEFGKILIVTPKQIGSAPLRNKIKRRIKSIFYQEKLYTKGYDFIVLCKKGIDKIDFFDLKKILLSLTDENNK